MSFEGDPPGIHIAAFDYDGRSFPLYRLEDVLNEMLVLERRLGSCGSALNEHLEISS